MNNLLTTMNDKKLRMISLIMAVVGAIGLAVASYQNTFAETRIYEISEKMIGKNVAVNGTITSISTRDGNTFITAEDFGSIEIILFDAGLSYKKGNNITAYGKVNVYKNKLEIIAEKIVVR